MHQKKVIPTSIRNPKIRVFLVFLSLSFVIWFLIELNKTAISQVVFEVEYTGISQSNIIQNKPVEKVEATIKASGFTLLKFKIRSKKIKFNLLSISKDNQKSYLLPNEQLAKINSQFSSKVEIVKIHTDTVFLELGKKIIKKVPVKLNIDITYKLGYHLVNTFELQPDSITVLGGEKYVSKIDEIPTKLIKIDNAYENISENVGLVQQEEFKNVSYSESEIKVVGEIDKITEGKFFIPVKIVNVPKEITVFPFPKEIQIIYQSGLAQFDKINNKSVEIFFDYHQYKKDTLLQYLTPIVKYKSDLITSLKIEPSQVEILIKK